MGKECERTAMLLWGLAPNFCIHMFCTRLITLEIILNGAASVQLKCIDAETLIVIANEREHKT